MATIAVVCPRCESQYQVDAALAGKRMRCPNVICRAVFEVKDSAVAAPDAAPPSISTTEPTPTETPSSESVAATTPTPAEVIPPQPEAPPPTEQPRAPVKRADPKPTPTESAPLPSWQGAPPPVRGQAPTAAAVEAAPADAPDFAELEGDAGSDAAPTDDGAQPTEEAAFASSPLFPEPETNSGARRRSLLLMLVMVIMLAGLGVGAVYLIQARQTSDEAERFQIAQDAYKNQDYAKTVTILLGLSHDFPDSTRRPEYRLLAELSELRAAVHRPSTDPKEASRSLDDVLKFLESYKNDALLKDRHGELWETLERLSKDLANLAGQNFNRDLLARAKLAWTEADKFTPPKGVSPVEHAKFFTGEFARVELSLRDKTFHDQSIALLRRLAENPSAASVEAALALIEQRNLDAKGEAAKILADLKANHFAGITYTSMNGVSTPQLTSPAGIANYVFAPSSYYDKEGPTGASPVFALARGILYALDPQRGDIRWARRLGIDSRHLPMSIPATLAHPALLIAIATDEPAVLGLAASDGRILWRQPLSSACVTLPVRVHNRLFVPLLSGRVDEIDLVSGRLWGFYELGQALTEEGVHQPGTELIYLPAGHTCLYVLDVGKQRCERVLYLRHAPGALQGKPLIVGDASTRAPKAASESWLLLSVARGKGAQLRRYALPIEDSDADPVETHALPSGHTFRAWCVADRLGVAGDDGSFTLLGIKPQGGDRLYPFVPDGATISPGSSTATPGLIAHADPERWWILGGGRLRHYLLGLNPKEGLTLSSEWTPGLLLGSPLHAAQVIDADEEPLLFLVTQAADEPTCYATAVDASTGRIRWQRRLGVIAQSPLQTAGADDVLFQGSRALYRIALAKDKQSWNVVAADPILKLNPGDHFFWLPHAKTPSCFTWPKSGAGPLRLHVLDAGKASTRSWNLPHPPLGTWTKHGNHFVMPLASGEMLALAGDGGKVQKLESWRGLRSDDHAPGHIVALDDKTFAATDGNLAVTLWRWAEFGAAPSLVGSKEFAQRIVAAPVALPRKDGRAWLAVADASQQLTLLDGETLKEIRSWPLPGRLSAGPVVRGNGILCVVGKNRLVWIDPDKSEPAGEYVGIAHIVGIPAAFDGQLVVADLSGQLTWLALEPGLPARRTHQIQAQVVPVATPVVIEGRVVVALSDGAVMSVEAVGKK